MGKLERTYLLIEAAAVAGERCPQGKPHGPLDSQYTTKLCRQGRLRIEVFAPNWRVATILTGPHSGESTMAAPNGGKPYVIVGKQTWSKRTLSGESGPPREGPSAPKNYSGGA